MLRSKIWAGVGVLACIIENRAGQAQLLFCIKTFDGGCCEDMWGRM